MKGLCTARMATLIHYRLAEAAAPIKEIVRSTGHGHGVVHDVVLEVANHRDASTIWRERPHQQAYSH
jgi:hypothetical protein